MAIKMGKSKQTKEKKFDRSVEISAPILDPEIIKAIHSPPPEHAGFKELLSGINNQDSIDEVAPLDERHIPSYIGIACAVSGYTNYSSLARQAFERARGNTPVEPDDANNGNENNNHKKTTTTTISRPTSPVLIRPEQHINHITLDKSHIHSPDEERKELTERLTASANEHWRSPSPTIPPTEDDRHHGAYVGARYFPLTPPAQNSSQLTNSSGTPKQIPLLGIDDDINLDKLIDDENSKNEQRIASLYGQDFAKDWGEKEKKMKKLSENSDNSINTESPSVASNNNNNNKKKTPKDLVKLKPTPKVTKKSNENSNESSEPTTLSEEFVKAANAKDKAKNFLSKMFGGSRSKSPSQSVESTKQQEQPEKEKSKESPSKKQEEISTATATTPHKPDESISAPKTPVNETKTVDSAIIKEADHNEDLVKNLNESHAKQVSNLHDEAAKLSENCEDHEAKAEIIDEDHKKETINTHVEATNDDSEKRNSQSHDGRYYLELLTNERLLLEELVKEAESKLPASSSELSTEDEGDEISGKIRSAIGKANLLITKKFKQFEELCDANINKSPDDQFATLNDDLAGFWDMILIQVDDIKKAFNNLSKSEPSNQASIDSLNSDDSTTNPTTTQSNVKPTKPKLSAEKDQARRGRLQEHINQMKAKVANSEQADDLMDTQKDPAIIASHNQEQLQDESSEQQITNITASQDDKLIVDSGDLENEQKTVIDESSQKQDD